MLIHQKSLYFILLELKKVALMVQIAFQQSSALFIVKVDELLTESVRLYPVLYNKADKFFKDVNKKTLAWEDMA